MSEQRVAVRLRAGCDLRADLSGSARLGLDHNRLLDQRLEHGRERTHDHVDRAAGRKRVDEGNRMGRISVLRKCRPQAESCCSRSTAGDEFTSIHVILPEKCLFYRDLTRTFDWMGCYRPARWAIKHQ